MSNVSAPVYRRLPGTGYRRMLPVWAMLLLFFVIGIFVLLLRGRRVQLWQGEDHLLLVESDGAREYYKRFAYRDIQALIIRKTSEGKYLNAVLGIFIFALAALALAIGDSVGLIVFLSIAGIVLLILLANIFQGPTCQCYLRTAVQTDELSSLTRVRLARQVLGRLRPMVESEQGRLTPEEVAQNLVNLPPAEVPPMIAHRRTAPATVPLRFYHGTVHLILFWLLLTDVPLTSLNVVLESTWTDVVSVLLMLVTLGYAITSLIKQNNTTLPPGLKRLPWFVLGWAGLMLATAIAYGIAIAINHPEVLDQSVLEDPVVLAMTTISTTVNAIMGFTGLVLLRKFRAANSAPAHEPPVADVPAA